MGCQGQGRDQATIAKAYQDIAHECGAMLAPVGKAWELILATTWLSGSLSQGWTARQQGRRLFEACVFYALLCEEIPLV